MNSEEHLLCCVNILCRCDRYCVLCMRYGVQFLIDVGTRKQTQKERLCRQPWKTVCRVVKKFLNSIEFKMLYDVYNCLFLLQTVYCSICMYASVCISFVYSYVCIYTHTDTHTHPFNGPLARTTRVGRYQKGKTKLDFTEARDSEWQWHPLGHVQVCTSLQTDNHASTPPLSFLQARCPSCCPTNSVKALCI